LSLWRDDKYLRLLSPQLQQFKQKSNHVYNFRCPLCGDSEVKKYKARGYVFPLHDVLMFKCHNCAVALPFGALLKRLSEALYREYQVERFNDRQPPPDAPSKPPVAPVRGSPQPRHMHSLADIRMYQDAFPRLCETLLPVVEYVKGRCLPDSALPRLYATDKAHTDLLKLVGEEKAGTVSDGVLYLVQPFRLPDGSWYGCQLRTLDKKEYLTFRWSHDPLKVFGLEDWNPAKLTYVVEGPLDALFVPNALAVCGSDLLPAIRILEDLGDDLMPLDWRRVYVWDNEPRNSEIVHHLRTAVKLHESVVIWPKDYPKDINDIVRAGKDVNAVLPRRTFTGLVAQLELETWLK
jgi:hypothetical protein